ncbi:MAG: methyltransferase domain-containing protein [Alphaproteobacteria bacterium]|nr:methyltransferase domain-containing protein [Alphaproteobacteria bacterium]
MTTGLDARRLAADAFLRISKTGVVLEVALENLPGFADLETRDRAFARAILSTSFRYLGQTQKVLDRFLSKPLEETAPPARAILITGATQLLWLETPAHAAVSASVSTAESWPQARKLKGLINAVLRRVAKDGPAIAKTLSPQDNLPDWMRQDWRKHYGPGLAARMALGILQPPPLDLTVKNPEEIDHWQSALEAERLPNNSLRLSKVGDVQSLPGFAEGAWWAQDAAATLPVQLLPVKVGDKVIDLCAAPGGKTLQLAARGAEVIAVDNSAGRLKRLRANLKRTNLNAEIVTADVRKWKPERQADHVLLDAPCSATGTLRRHPESSWIKSPDDISRFARLQRELARAASKMVHPGGSLIVCTCSLQREEGEDLARDIAKRDKTLEADPIKASELPGLEDALTPDGWVRTTPALWKESGGMDGFFIARFRKSG